MVKIVTFAAMPFPPWSRPLSGTRAERWHREKRLEVILSKVVPTPKKVPPQWVVLAALHTFWGGSACPAGRALRRRAEYDEQRAGRNWVAYDHSVTGVGVLQ